MNTSNVFRYVFFIEAKVKSLMIKLLLILFLILIFFSQTGLSQIAYTIEIIETIEPEENTARLKSGIFYFKHWLPLQNTLFQ